MAKLEYGINLNPNPRDPNDHAAKPKNAADLQGLKWARIVFKVSAAGFPDLAAAFAAYDPLIDTYNQLGIRTLVILNQETFWGSGPWQSNTLAAWQNYAHDFGIQAGQIAAHYRDRNVAYEIWNEGDIRGESSVYVDPPFFAPVLEASAAAIRSHDPDAEVVLGGLASGTGTAIQYVKGVRAALGGDLPVDAIGVHPYGHWPPSGKPNIPTGWFGALDPALHEYVTAFAGVPVWITEVGVSEPQGIGSAHWPDVAEYAAETLTLVQQHYALAVPVVIWFGWSDWMRGAGIVDRSGNPKQPIYDRFFEIARAPFDGQPTPVIPSPTDLTPTDDGLRVREGPGTDFDVLSHVNRGERLSLVESWGTAWAKLGQPGEWIHVQTPGDGAGWAAAWFLKLAMDVPDQAPPLVTPTDDNLRLREGPGLQFPVLERVNVGDVLAVLENWPAAVAKLGKSGEWLNTRTPQGFNGWAAAWFLRLLTNQEIRDQLASPVPAEPTVCPDEALLQALAFEREVSFDRVPVSDPSKVNCFSGFGPNNYSYLTYAQGHDYYRNLQGLHNGVDFCMPVGTPLCSVDWGVVVHVSRREGDNPYAAGPYSIIIRYGGFVALYGHMQGLVQGKHVFVKQGDIVAPGQPIGLSGTSNNAPHLHFEMRKISQTYIDHLRREAEAFDPDPLERLRHMQAHFHLRGWEPTETHYVNPAPFFTPALETYQQDHNWQDACPLEEDTNDNGYPDQVILAGQQAPQDSDLYSLKSMPPWGPHFWKGSFNLVSASRTAAPGESPRGPSPRAREDKPDWHYVG
ncbi:MAG: SH3 domain-containing protein [Anaerolineae bacterium]|jgi:murein DD-endopeptidase MepM/ murein hydrolase activator NlpD